MVVVMKNVIRFLSRDIVNTIMLLLVVVFFIASVVRGFDLGLLYGLVALFIIRFMLWHYRLWDLVNAYVTDNETRVNVFGLPGLSENKKADEKKPLLFRIVEWLILLAGVFLFGYLVVTLIFQ